MPSASPRQGLTSVPKITSRLIRTTVEAFRFAGNSPSSISFQLMGNEQYFSVKIPFFLATTESLIRNVAQEHYSIHSRGCVIMLAMWTAQAACRTTELTTANQNTNTSRPTLTTALNLLSAFVDR